MTLAQLCRKHLQQCTWSCHLYWQLAVGLAFHRPGQFSACYILVVWIGPLAMSATYDLALYEP